MAEYLSPGVYVEEIDAGPKPIEGVSTSTSGAVGVTARGPDTGKPLLITSFADYVRQFGGPVEAEEVVKARWTDDPEKGEFWNFPLSVKGFFDNGGQRLYVRRVVSKAAVAADGQLGRGLSASILANAPKGTTTLRLDHTIGVDRASQLRLRIDGTLSGNIGVKDYDRTSGLITIDTPLPADVVAGRDLVQIATKTTASLKLKAKSVGTWGKYISVRCRPMEAGSFALLADPALAAPNATNPAKTTKIAANSNGADDKFDVSDGLDFFQNDRILVDGKTFTIKNKNANTFTIDSKTNWRKGGVVKKVGSNAAGTTIGADKADSDVIDVVDATLLNQPPAAPAAGDMITVNGVLYRIGAVNNNALTVERVIEWKKDWAVIRLRYAASQVGATPEVYVWGVSALYKDALVELEDDIRGRKYYGTVTTITGNKVKVTINWPPQNPPGPPQPAFDLWEGSRLRLIEAVFDIRYEAPDGPPRAEEIRNVRLSGANTDPMHIDNRLDAQSALVDLDTQVNVTSMADFPLAVDVVGGNPPEARAWLTLANGDDAFGSLDPDAFVGVDGGPGKRTGIQSLEDIDDISITMAPGIWSSLVQSALIQQAELLKYRFAILDPRPVNPNSIDPIGDVQAFRAGFDTKYAALYFPRIEVRDPFKSETVGLGPSGHMAGIYARVDVERGVHKAPANEVIRGIDLSNGFHGLEDEITKREQDVLNPRGINALRFFPNRGTRVWGARTLSSDGAWKYINVRRIFIWVERSIDVGTQWVVFEPNDEKTWARVRQTITNFLTTVWRSGALFGLKAEEAFFVRCDRTTMTQDDIDNGRLICVIGIAPVKPAEFVIFRIQQKLIDQKEP